MMRNKLSLLLFFFLIYHGANAQFNSFNWKRSFQRTDSVWNKIILTPDIIQQLENNINGIRIYGIKANDTLEIPYVLKTNKDETLISEIPFELINRSKNEKGNFITFKTKKSESCNQIYLSFEENNFDALIDLEGSQDQKEWFTLAEKQRILSIKNNAENYSFTRLYFPASSFMYFRMRIPAINKLTLNAASVSNEILKPGKYDNYSFSKKVLENKELKQTEINLDFGKQVLISRLNLKVADQFDFYRPLQIQSLADSFKTQQGWEYSYRDLQLATLSSLEKSEYNFESIITSKLRVIIRNDNNLPLKTGEITVSGSRYELMTRLNDASAFYLVYGNANCSEPEYDIQKFADKIPAEAPVLQLKNAEKTGNNISPVSEPVFKSPLWLWSLLVIIVLILGLFTLKMMKTESGKK